MSGAGAHRFRLVAPDGVDALQVGATLVLASDEAAHLRVLRRGVGDPVDVVGPGGVVWEAQVVDPGAGTLELLARRAASTLVQVELVAGVLVGGRFDELVDGAVQAGAATIAPFATTRRDAERIAARRPRLARIARAAAKQSRRAVVPEVLGPLDEAALLALDPGVLLDAGGGAALLELAATGALPQTGGAVRLLVGGSEGLEPELVARLVDRGWASARLGPTVLRAELAAAVAVAVVAMAGDPAGD